MTHGYNELVMAELGAQQYQESRRARIRNRIFVLAGLLIFTAGILLGTQLPI
jgi:hypothetical protein